MIDEELKALILQNKETLESLEDRLIKIQRKLMWHTVGGILKVVLIVGPLVVGVIYVLPFVREYFSVLEPVFNFFKFSAGGLNGEVLNSSDTAAVLGDERLRVLLEQYCNN